jgi:hypothetical protein
MMWRYKKVSMLSSIVDESHSIIKKDASSKYNVIWMMSKKFVTICLSIFSTGTRGTNKFDTNGTNRTKWISVTFRIWIRSKEKDRKELVSQMSCNQPCSKAAQKKQKVSVTDPKLEEVMKLVNEMCVHHVETMFAIDYSNHFIFTGTWTGLKIWSLRMMKKRFQSQMS